jgi:hypothetical protein
MRWDIVGLLTHKSKISGCVDHKAVAAFLLSKLRLQRRIAGDYKKIVPWGINLRAAESFPMPVFIGEGDDDQRRQ